MRIPSYQLILSLTLSLITTPIMATPSLDISNAWIPQAPPVSQVMAAFMEINNPSEKAVEIIAVSSPDFSKVEMHLSKQVEGIAKMLPQDKLLIPAKGQLKLQPGSYHLMLMKPKKQLKQGNQTELTFKLSNGDIIKHRVTVKPGMDMMDHQHHHH